MENNTNNETFKDSVELKFNGKTIRTVKEYQEAVVTWLKDEDYVEKITFKEEVIESLNILERIINRNFVLPSIILQGNIHDFPLVQLSTTYGDLVSSPEDIEEAITKQSTKVKAEIEAEESVKELPMDMGEFNKELKPLMEEIFLSNNKALEEYGNDEPEYARVTDEPDVNSDADDRDMVNHPNHYTVSKVETIEYMEFIWGTKALATYCAVNTLKYRERAPYKGKEEEDYSKAEWYYNKAKELTSKVGTPEEILPIIN